MIRVPQFFFEGDTGGGTGTGSAGATGGSTTLLGGSGAAGDQSGAGGQGAAGGTAAGTGAADPWFKDAKTGVFADNWRNNLPENLRSAEPLKVIGSFEDLAKSYVETKAMVGKKLEAPGEGATPEQIAAWRKTVGAPEKWEGYRGEAKSLRPDTVPEELWDAESEGKFLELAHKHHLPPSAVKEILGFHAEAVKGALDKTQVDSAAALQAEGAKLRSEWGSEFGANMALAARAAKTVGLDPATDPLFTVAKNVIAFGKMAKLLSESQLVKGENPSMASTIASRASDITDPKSQSQLAREYRGDFGPERQAAAQGTLHDLLKAQKAA